MTYTAKSGRDIRETAGTITDKIATEFGLVDTEIDTVKSKYVVLTSTTGTNAAKATAGIDLASGSDISIWGWFFPKAVTLIKMHDVLTEAYVKDTTDAKIEVYNNANEKLFGRTVTAAGEAVDAAHATSPETGKASVAAGTIVYVKAVNTGSSSGTGHAIVVLEYTNA